MKQKPRTKTLRVKVNEDEWNLIQKRLEVCTVSSMSDLFRQMILHGIYLEFDHEELRKIRQAVMSVANNINQITHRVNSTSRIYKQELYEIQENVNKLWLELNFIQTELKKLNPSNIWQRKWREYSMSKNINVAELNEKYKDCPQRTNEYEINGTIYTVISHYTGQKSLNEMILKSAVEKALDEVLNHKKEN